MDTALSPEWVRVLGRQSGSLAVVGPDAVASGRSLRPLGPFASIHESDGFVLLSSDTLDEAPAGLEAVPAGTLAAVVLRRAWQDRTAVLGLLRAAHRVLCSGGMVLALELDAARLLASSAVRYPLRLRFDSDPEALATLRRTTVDPSSLLIDATRAGFRGVVDRRIEEERGRYPSWSAFWQRIREGAWPSLSAMAPEARETLLAGLERDLRAALPLGDVIDREPWVAVTGFRP